MKLMGVAVQWTLLAIVMAFALIGFLHLTRGTAVRHVRGVRGVAILFLGAAFEDMLSAFPCTIHRFADRRTYERKCGCRITRGPSGFHINDYGAHRS